MTPVIEPLIDANEAGAGDGSQATVAWVQNREGLALPGIFPRSMDCREDRISEPPAFASKRKVRK
jgi:hypothetical protein